MFQGRGSSDGANEQHFTLKFGSAFAAASCAETGIYVKLHCFTKTESMKCI